jgi:hypothetical protein
MNRPLDRSHPVSEMMRLSDEWWSMSWWDQTGRKGDDWERRMDEWHRSYVAAGGEPMW